MTERKIAYYPNNQLEEVSAFINQRVTINNIQAIADKLAITEDIVYVTWNTKQKVKRAYGNKTLYKENLVKFEKIDGSWTKRVIPRPTRTI